YLDTGPLCDRLWRASHLGQTDDAPHLPLAQRREALGHIPTEPTHPHVIISQESERLPPPSGSPTSAPDEVHRFSPEVENTRHLVSGKDRKSTRLNSSHVKISYAVFCLK